MAEVPSFRREEGARAMAMLLDRDAPLDAVFCFDDALAMGALRALADLGCAFPRTSP